MTPEFSIVIPVFNASATLQDSLDSVARQTYRKFEVIIVNDGSTDGSNKIIERWKSGKDFRVEVVNQENKGLGAARNAGVVCAQNPWIVFLDADDIWKAQKLEQLSNFITKNTAEVYYHQVISFGLGKGRVRKSYPVKSVSEILAKGNPIVPSATVISKNILKRYPFTENKDYHGVEDFHLWLRLLRAGQRLEYFKAPLSLYRESGGMSTNLEDHLNRVFKVLEDLYHEKFFSKEDLKIAKQRKYLEAARFYHKRNKHSPAEKFYKASNFRSWKVQVFRFLNFMEISI